MGVNNLNKSIIDFNSMIDIIKTNKDDENINLFTPNELTAMKKILMKVEFRLNNNISGKFAIIEHERDNIINELLE